MKHLVFVIFLLLVLSAALVRYTRPEYNWDMLPYMAIVLGYDNPDADSVHSQTYSVARQQLPPKKFAALIDSSNVFRGNAYRNTSVFHDQLPFYSIKPFYIHLIRFSRFAGFPLTQATVIPSLVSFVLICVLMYFWIHRHTPEPYAFIISIAVIGLPFLLEGAGSSTPDLMCAAFLLLGSYTLLEKESVPLALVFFTGALATRIDSILFALVLMGYSVFHHRKHRVLVLSWAALTSLGVILLYKGAGLDLSQLPLVRSASERIADVGAEPWLMVYVKGVVRGLANLMHSGVAFFLIVAVATFYIGSSSHQRTWRNPVPLLLLCIVFHVALRFLLHPIVEDRFIIADYLLILIVLLMTMQDTIGTLRRMT